MVKPILLLVVALVALVAESSSQRIIRPTYRPPRRGPVIIRPTYRPPVRQPILIRAVREANDEPLWLYKDDNIPRAPSAGEHPVLPSIIDDIKLDPNTRTARSVDSPSARRHGGHSSKGSGSRNTGATHPGYNRRNARDIRIPDIYDPFRPTLPKPHNPFKPGSIPHRPFPIYARTTRDIHIPGVQKPTHHDVIIPNWNPNARVNPWQRLEVKSRNTRSVEMLDSQEDLLRNARSVDMSTFEDQEQEDLMAW